MDINELYTAPLHDKGAEVQIKNPITSELTDCWIKVVGVDSKRFRDSQRKRQREVLDALRDSKPLNDDEFGILVDATIGWKGFTNKGKEWKFSKANVKVLYKNSPKIAEQVDRFVADRRNFIKG